MSDNGDLGTGHGEVLASRLAEARRVLGLTQQDVALFTGLNRSAISQIENGTRKVSGTELIQLARLYRRPLAWFTGAESPVVPDEVLSAVAGLSERDRDSVIAFARFLAHQEVNR